MNEPHQRLAGRRIDVALLPHRLADALRDAAMGLAVDDQRIDAAADVVDRGVAGDLDVAGVGIDLDLADRAAVRKHRLVHLVVGDDREAVLEIVAAARPRGLLGEFEEIEAAVAVAATKAAVVEVDLVRRRVERSRRRSACPARSGPAPAFAITVPAWRIERPECEPPPTLTMSVSPMMMLTVSTGTASRSATTCAKLVSWPWPLGCVPITTSTRPSGRTVISGARFGAPIEDST